MHTIRRSPSVFTFALGALALLGGCGDRDRSRPATLTSTLTTSAAITTATTTPSTSIGQVALPPGPRLMWTTTPNPQPNVNVGVWNIPLAEQESLPGYRLRGLDLIGDGWRLQDATPDGRFLLFTDVLYTGSSVLFDRRTEQGITVPLPGAQRLSADGRFVLTSFGGVIQLYDRQADGTMPLPGIGGQVLGSELAMSRDAVRIAYVSGSGLTVYDTTRQTHTFSASRHAGLYGSDGGGQDPLLSADGRYLVYVSGSAFYPSGLVLVHDFTADAAVLPARLHPTAGRSFAYRPRALSATGRYLLLQGTGQGPFGATLEVALYDLSDNRYADLSALGHVTEPVGLSISDDGQSLGGVWKGAAGAHPRVFLFERQASTLRDLGPAQTYRAPISSTLIR